MVEPKLARAYGTLAGFGFIGVAVLALPSTRLLDPAPAPEAYLLTLAGLVTGLICLAIPWDWLDPRWLHVVGMVATVETAATVAVFGLPYVAFYFMVAVLVAYIAPDLRTIALQLGLIMLALFGSALYGPDDARTSLAVALAVAPVLVLTAGLFSYLRLKMVHDRRAYHRFAEQTLVLSSRIAGRQVGPMGIVPPPESVPSFAWVRPPSRWVGGAAALLGIPLLAGSLAVAGVKLPSVASDPFERVGIDLPNQEAAVSQPARSAAAVNGSRDAKRDRPASRRGASRASEAPSADAAARARQKLAAGTTSTATDTQEPAPPAAVGSGDPVPAGPATPSDAVDREKSRLGGVFDEATKGLEGLLDDLASEEK